MSVNREKTHVRFSVDLPVLSNKTNNRKQNLSLHLI